ncbi:PLP-dependent aminotransferase family protein [Anoxybacterium hadale]|uniref:PLP-dependent aminotransferase family protein n=1 Tax=Anoxybacterium hadale TaxID=3408580 RepID=A0ACD1AG96_9FIRM|nr:PLP-dependent aminotransferase family protein [Clostridiales bacterium]
MKREVGRVYIDWTPDKGSDHPVYQQIVDYISGKISSGDWIIGSLLPSQRTLAERFGVNRSTVVRALEELISYGILEGEPGRGTIVRSNTWSLLMSTAPPDWGSYVKSGAFQENVPTIQTINKLEFKKDIIRLGTGELSPDLFPRELMSELFHRLSQKVPSLNYLEPLGLPELREALSQRLKKQGIDADPSCILITSGSLQALQLISVCILKPGSVVYTEAPSYLKSLQVFPSAGMRLSGVPMDREGLLYWTIKEEDALLYTIPTYHNPTGILMSESRRQELFRFCSSRRLPMIEDDAYGDLWLEERPPRPLKALDKNGMILYLGTISKTLAPGLRIGWLVGPQSVVERLGDVKMQVDYGASSLSQWAVTELFKSGLYDDYLTGLRIELKKRRDRCLQLLDQYMSGLAKWDIPRGSFYIWLRLVGRIQVDQLFQLMLKDNILINPGNVYDFEKNQSVRLSYSYASEKEMETGIRKLAEVLRDLT